MVMSPEYPDLKWVEPRAWGSGRDGKAVRYIVIHYTAGSEHATSAEDGARYNQERTDGTSAHYFVDRDSIVQGVRTRDRANCARKRGNRLGIQYELCGTAQTRAQWLDAASLATLKLAARQVARDCRKYDIPVRRLSVAETRRAWTEFPAGPRGIVGHVDCTYAYPEDGGDHTDPGTHFPWDVFLDLVQTEMEDDDMPLTGDDIKRIWAYDPGNNANGEANGGVANPAWKKPGDNATVNPAYGIGRAIVGLEVGYQVRARVDALTDMVKALSTLVSNSAAEDEETDVEVLRRLNAAIAAAEAVPGRTVEALAGGSDADVAEVLRTVLGRERAAAVAALLAG